MEMKCESAVKTENAGNHANEHVISAEITVEVVDTEKGKKLSAKRLAFIKERNKRACRCAAIFSVVMAFGIPLFIDNIIASAIITAFFLIFAGCFWGVYGLLCMPDYSRSPWWYGAL